MKILNNEYSCKFVLKFYIMNDNETLLRVIESPQNTLKLNIIPEDNDLIRVTVNSLLRMIPEFNHYGKVYHDFLGKNVIIDKHQYSDSDLIFYDNIKIIINKNNIIKYANTNLNRPEWSKGITDDEIRRLSLDDIVSIYNQTMREGISIVVNNYI